MFKLKSYSRSNDNTEVDPMLVEISDVKQHHHLNKVPRLTYQVPNLGTLHLKTEQN